MKKRQRGIVIKRIRDIMRLKTKNVVKRIKKGKGVRERDSEKKGNSDRDREKKREKE